MYGALRSVGNSGYNWPLTITGDNAHGLCFYTMAFSPGRPVKRPVGAVAGPPGRAPAGHFEFEQEGSGASAGKSEPAEVAPVAGGGSGACDLWAQFVANRCFSAATKRLGSQAYGRISVGKAVFAEQAPIFECPAAPGKQKTQAERLG